MNLHRGVFRGADSVQSHVDDLAVRQPHVRPAPRRDAVPGNATAGGGKAGSYVPEVRCCVWCGRAGKRAVLMYAWERKWPEFVPRGQR